MAEALQVEADRPAEPARAPVRAELNSLQVGRGLAALAVVAFHLSTAFGDPRYGGERVFADVTRRGNLGVDFFFVLSGFIILHAHQADIGRPGRWGRYIYRRFLRLYPIYWLYTLAISGLVLLGLSEVLRLPQTVSGWVSALSLVRLSRETPPLGVAWTLFHEVAFYLLFSVAILSRRAGVAILALWGIVCATAYQYPETAHPTPLAVYTAAYNLNFFMGMAALWLYQRGRAAWPMFLTGLAGAAATLAAEYAGYSPTPLLYGASFALAVAGAAILDRRGQLRFPWVAKRLGDASYTLYLMHVPVVGLLLKILLHLGLDRLITRQGVFFVVLAGTAAIAIAAFTLVEQPLLNRLRSLVPPRRAASVP